MPDAPALVSALLHELQQPGDPTVPDGVELVAFADTRHLGRSRWTELSVFRFGKDALPDSDGKRWLAVSAGKSEREGERVLIDHLFTYGLERALELFDDSPIGRQVKAQARDWDDRHGMDELVADEPPLDVEPLRTYPRPRFDGETDQDALDWLFGEEAASRKARAKALGVGESTLRMQLAPGGAGVRVPLLCIVDFIDQEAFRAALGSSEGGA